MTFDPYAPQPSMPPSAPQPGAQPPPGMPPYQPQQQFGVEVNGKAVAALVCGVLFCTSPLGIIPLVLGKSAQRQIEMGMGIGRALAKAGVILGWIGVAFTIFWIAYFAIIITTIVSTFNSYQAY
jgi:ABC-type antimicrobial peptide transport system permease subunit